MKISALLLLLLGSHAAAQTVLLHPLASQSAPSIDLSASIGPALAPDDSAHRLVGLDVAALDNMQSGDEASIDAPDGTRYSLIYERSETGYGGGKIWVGYLRDFGKNYPVLFSVYQGAVNGSIATPSGELSLHGSLDAALLTDLHAAGRYEFVPTQDDTQRPTQIDAQSSGLLARDGELDRNGSGDSNQTTAATPASKAQIDLLILFTPQLQSALGGYSATIARINLLVATANSVYYNSRINLTLNLVSAQSVNYSYAGAVDSSALSSLHSDSNVTALRAQYGADLVSLIRPFNTSSNLCGLAYVSPDFTAASSAFGYSVIEDSGNSFSGPYCDVTTLTHELGHNLGAVHDLATTAAQGGAINGTPSYNRGYCNGYAATVMSYVNPANGCSLIVPYFSNPSLTTSCGGGSCGVPQGQAYTAIGSTASATGADSSSALNLNAPQLALWRTAPIKFVPIMPARILDTRSAGVTGDGLFAGIGALASGASLNLGVTGRGGIPMNAVGSVVLNVTAINPSAAGYLTVWPTGSAMPLASNLNFTAGQTIPNLVIAKVGSSGNVSIYSGNSRTDLVADVAGWFPTGSGFNSLVPARLLDTRAGAATSDGRYVDIGALGPNTELDLPVLGRGHVPASGVAAVALNVTVTAPTAPSYITAWSAGTSRPLSSNLNFVAGQTIPNLVISRVGADGAVALYNSAGQTDLVADVAGWFATDSELTAIMPQRLLDNRPGGTTSDGEFAGAGALGPGAQLGLRIVGRAGIPTSASAVVLNVTAVYPSGAGVLTVWPTGSAQPATSNLNFTPGVVVANLVIAKIGSNGSVTIANSAGSTYVVADAVGWFAANQ